MSRMVQRVLAGGMFTASGPAVARVEGIESVSPTAAAVVAFELQSEHLFTAVVIVDFGTLRQPSVTV